MLQTSSTHYGDLIDTAEISMTCQCISHVQNSFGVEQETYSLQGFRELKKGDIYVAISR